MNATVLIVLLWKQMASSVACIPTWLWK